MAENEFVVTPWEVSGEIDYEKLITRFGTQKIDDALKERIKKDFGELHFMIERDLIFSHRDLIEYLEAFEKKEPIYLYTGRGPSGKIHLGHMIPLMFTKWLQDMTGATLLFQFTDDEKFLFKDKLSRKETLDYAYENMLDVIALGFKPENTKFIIDTQNAKTMYPLSLEVAKKLTLSTAKAVFGFENHTNVGSIYFTSMQTVPAMLPTIIEGKPTRVLIPCAIDQDPHFRVTRDIIPKLGYPKPALIHSKMMPSLRVAGKMSASDEESAIYTTDSEETVNKKVARAFTGGRATLEEQKKLGGNPDICSVCAYFKFFFEPNTQKLEKRLNAYRKGKVMDGENKQELAKRINKFLKQHQAKREKARSKLKKYLFKDIVV
ncbi:Tryptophan--tRNA ligase [uncultured archaeon]|nr:Tryptophan--tRNA ligase [uncultured archaeon]